MHDHRTNHTNEDLSASTVVLIYPHDDVVAIDREFLETTAVPVILERLPAVERYEVTMGGSGHRHQATVELTFAHGTHVRGLVDVLERVGRLFRVPFALPVEPVVVLASPSRHNTDLLRLALAS